MDEQNKNIGQKNQELSIWKKHFTGWNFVINVLIALIPASLVIGILREMGFGGALIIIGVLWGFIYLAGLLREKISKGGKKTIERTDKIENKKVIKNNKPKNKKIVWIIILIVIVSILISFFILNNRQESTDENLILEKTDKEEIIGNLYRNNQYKFRIKFPEGWEIKDGDGQNVVKKAVSGGSTIGIIIKDFKNTPEFLELKDKFVKETGMPLTDDIAEEVVSELNANDFSDKDFEDMMTGVLEGIESSPRDLKLVEKKIGNIGGEKAFYTKTETSVKVLHIGEGDMIGITYTTLHGGIFYHIFAGFPKEDVDQIEKQIFLSIASFVFENF